MHVHTVKCETDYGGGIGTVGAEGPNAGIDVGFKTGTDFTGVALMAEASAVKAEVTLDPAYLSGNINANTGVKMGSGGFQLNILGWGATLGVGGRWTVDTPVGSAGASIPPSTMTLKHEPQTIRS